MSKKERKDKRRMMMCTACGRCGYEDEFHYAEFSICDYYCGCKECNGFPGTVVEIEDVVNKNEGD